MTEFDKFDRTMKQLIKIPHSEIKAKLDAERVAKEKRRKAKRPSASAREGGEKD